MRVLEVCTFTLQPGITPSAFLDTVPSTTEFLKRCPGFQRRHLAQAEDGGWIDMSEWADMDAAKNMVEVFHKDPSTQAFCAAIDMTSSRMVYYTLAHSVDG